MAGQRGRGGERFRSVVNGTTYSRSGVIMTTRRPVVDVKENNNEQTNLTTGLSNSGNRNENYTRKAPPSSTARVVAGGESVETETTRGGANGNGNTASQRYRNNMTNSVLRGVEDGVENNSGRMRSTITFTVRGGGVNAINCVHPTPSPPVTVVPVDPTSGVLHVTVKHAENLNEGKRFSPISTLTRRNGTHYCMCHACSRAPVLPPAAIVNSPVAANVPRIYKT